MMVFPFLLWLWLRTRAVLDKEQEEKKESEASVAAFRRQLAAIKEKCASLDAEIELHRRNVANLMRGTSMSSASHHPSTRHP